MRTSTTTTLRLSANERAALDEAAADAGLGPSAFARLAVVKAAGAVAGPTRKRRSRNAQAVTKALGELGKIGNNINQIARHANTTGEADIAAVKAELARLTLAVMSMRDPA